MIDTKFARGYRAICLCDDCQAYAHYLGRAGKVLDANGGTDVFPATPAQLKILRGLENLRGLRLTPNGMYRWYAGCCKTPIANTPASLAMPYVGVVHVILEKTNSAETLQDYFGPVQARIQGKFGIAPLPSGTSEKVSIGFLLRVLKFLFMATIRKMKTPSPFFDEAGRPKVKPYVLSRDERESLRPLCGPR